MDCPFINAGYPPCSKHLNIGNLSDAFEGCVDQFTICPIYLQLMGLAKAGAPESTAETVGAA